MNNDLQETKKTVSKMQAVIFRILCDIDSFCKENNIRYFLSGGTCLGAIRHHGFIPWDDDADLMMPRKDYEMFIALFPQRFKNIYGFGSLQTDPEWQRPYARVFDLNTIWKSKLVQEKEMGVLVDIFPIDGVPKSKFNQSLFFGKLKILGVFRNSSIRINFLKHEPGVWLKKVIGIFVKPFGARFFAQKIERLVKRYPFSDSEYVACSVPIHYGKKEIIPRRQMEREIYMRFNNKLLPVPIGYDEYLSNLYGDYMTIPKDAETKGFTHLNAWEIQFIGSNNEE